MSARNDKFREQLSAYLDGELSEAEAAAVARAVEADSQLARELDRLRAVKELVAALPRQSAPAELASRVLARAEREGRFAARAPWGVRLARLAAAALVLIAVGLGVTMVCYLAGPPRPGQPDIAAVTDEPQPPVVAVAGVRAVDRHLAAIEAGDMPVVQLNAGNRVLAEQELEEMFSRNKILHVAKVRPKAALADAPEVANFYDRTQTGLNQTRYTVVMDTKRLRRIVGELNALRASHDIAVIPMSRQLEFDRAGRGLALRRGRDRKVKDEGDVAHLHYASARITSRARGPAAEPMAEPKPPLGNGKKTGPEVAPATTRPAAKPLPPARPTPTTAPLDYRQFVQDAKLRGDRLATVDFNELVIIVNGAIEAIDAAEAAPAGE